ncbi:hypothetical protein CC2G_014236 [Coprinopsis cinerea AmutBmut pab1-1]|nr:hypothetical protein CC2G_014236 [Coprinopsis cinerea AmutBmut pab1-1]
MITPLPRRPVHYQPFSLEWLLFISNYRVLENGLGRPLILQETDVLYRRIDCEMVQASGRVNNIRLQRIAVDHRHQALLWRRFRLCMV